MQSHIRKVYACLAVTCHLHFWQNDRDILRATVVTWGWNGYRNKSQHRKSTLEKKILPPLQQGFEPATFQSRVRRSNHWAIPAPVLPGQCAHVLCRPIEISVLFKLSCVWIFPLPIQTFPQRFLIINLIMSFWDFFCPFFFSHRKENFFDGDAWLHAPGTSTLYHSCGKPTQKSAQFGYLLFLLHGQNVAVQIEF